MVGITEIAGAISGLKGAIDVAKGLKATSDAVAINDVKIALQGPMIDAQQALLLAQETHSADLARISDLEQEIMRLKDWEAEKQRYQLVNADSGAFAYMPKAGMERGQPAHWLCANCFDQGRKSFVQRRGNMGMRNHFGCTSCGDTFTTLGTVPTYPAPVQGA